MSDSPGKFVGRKVHLPHAEYELDQYYVLDTAAVFLNGFPYAAVREPAGTGTFHLVRLGPNENRRSIAESEQSGVLYQPVHPSMTPEDVQGATYAHDDGTYWLFAHCSPEEQRDFAADAEAFAVAQFGEAIQRSNAEGARADTNVGRNTAYTKSDALILFARKVGRRVHKVVVGETLGYWHRNPHHDHKRELAVAALRAELQVLRQNQESDADSRAMLSRVKDASAVIISRLTATASIEWRHERQQRIQLEDIKKAIRGTDPVGGFEYIFTAGATADAPTGEDDLPSPLWASDAPALASGIVRGGYTYYDGYPLTLGSTRPYALVFKRATGTPDWSFVQAVKVYGGTS